jgi:hypothetical protein
MSSRLENVANKDMVVEIKRLHNELKISYKTDLAKAVRIGELLRQKKASIAHGEWEKWVRANLPFTSRTASEYMWVASHKGEYSKATTIAGLRAANTMGRQESPKTQAPAQETGTITRQEPKSEETSDLPATESQGQESQEQEPQESILESRTFSNGTLSLLKKAERLVVALDTGDEKVARKFFEGIAQNLKKLED